MDKGALIGTIIRLQVQTQPLKTKGVGYSPDPLLAVDTAAIDAWGMVASHEGTWVIDAHHKAHPYARGGGRRPLSIGFTGHYDAMADRFGEAPIGVAGENIIVDGPALSLADLGEGVVVETANGELIPLERPRVAAPCVEFTSFMLGLDAVAPLAEIEGPLGDLHDGRRGFIVAADHSPTSITISVGDKLYHAA